MSSIPSLLDWGARSIGPRVHRLLLAQLLIVTLVAGINGRSIAQLLPALRADADLRAGALVLVALTMLFARSSLRAALCPTSLVSLRRQPLGAGSFALLALPWAVPLAWPWGLILGLGHPGDIVVAIAGASLGALAVCGIAGAGSWRAAVAWTATTLLTGLLLDRAPAFAWPVLMLAGSVGAGLAGRGVRQALAGLAPAGAGSTRAGVRPAAARTPLGALLALDRYSLGLDRQWTSAALFPLLATLYVIVLDANGNCRGDCLDIAVVLVVSLAVRLPVAVLDTLRRVQGRHFVVPDRVVSTRLRLASLFVVAVVSLAPFVLVLAVLAREPAALPHAAAVALVALYRQLCDTTRAATPGPLVWLLAVPTAIVLLPAELRVVASALVATAFALLAARRGRRLRRDLAASRTAFPR